MRQPIQVAIYCVREGEDGPQWLMLKRIAEGGGLWQGVTGGVEDDETAREAALRELREETGLTPTDFHPIDFTYTFPVPTDMQHLYEPEVNEIREMVFLALVDNDAEPVLDSTEHDSCRWCSLAEADYLLYWPGNRTSLTQCARRLQSIHPHHGIPRNNP
jgi:dATP pyrophosphohydrolase